MNNNPLYSALAGAAIVALGAFMPIVKLPVVGSVNYFMNGKGDGSILLVLAVAAAIGAASKKYKVTGWSGIGCAVMAGYTFIQLQLRISQIKKDMAGSLQGNPFRGLAEAMINSIQLEFGWIVIAVGIALLLYAGFFAKNDAAAPATESSAS